ncbi:RHS repeat-associated core domain-containing protein [Pseudomonas idahonensis]|uniref:RHS repeat-associated core domain-containing protein n=1 Tax=Pseudomonas idahonensis TaxID=2942628 RepID=UPI00235F05F6|nr:RHS repeat-associated core domain-containing protein [Pseudomonas idahonensis]
MPINKTTCPIRFPGQYYDEESGLHYNRHRYYDPETAQYLSPDPLGLGGGTRPQGYVDNPLSWVDPLGLATCPKEAAAKITENASNGKIRRGKDYHGRLGHDAELDILSNPENVYQAKNGNLVFHKDGDIVVTHGKGGAQGNVITSYGQGGPRGESGAAIYGGTPSDPGIPITSEMITSGNIPKPNGGFLPPATKI